ncbi:hypothetical protein BDV27DRAFT_4201 [Aspergillus caelatus]|uniref:Uncharacterized protein n=1 Tax=Aspergillus caelatus TaxID=61420 RepID=A0A5N7A1F2_9EURO|nr:uncharacterized protein BDV27DRAFT_4201 [Aspergillus caelatus]KAE8363681.1 hypothetical protein BDV27DRAFT_4201 [Aspergillus caelatus]
MQDRWSRVLGWKTQQRWMHDISRGFGRARRETAVPLHTSQRTSGRQQWASYAYTIAVGILGWAGNSVAQASRQSNHFTYYKQEFSCEDPSTACEYDLLGCEGQQREAATLRSHHNNRLSKFSIPGFLPKRLSYIQYNPSRKFTGEQITSWAGNEAASGSTWRQSSRGLG